MMQLETDTSICYKEHPWSDSDWSWYFRVQKQEDARQDYRDEIARKLKRADAELALLLAELKRIQSVEVPALAEPARKAVIREIRQDIKWQRAWVNGLIKERNRTEPNWRAFLKEDDPRYNPTIHPHFHIGSPSAGWKRGGYPPPWWDGG